MELLDAGGTMRREAEWSRRKELEEIQGRLIDAKAALTESEVTSLSALEDSQWIGAAGEAAQRRDI